MDFEKKVRQAIAELHKNPNSKNKAIVSECVGLLDDIHTEIQEQLADGTIKFDTDIVVKIDGDNTVKFQNDDDFAEWLHGIID